MTSFISKPLRLFLKLQKRAQHGVSIEAVRGLSRWTERLYSLPSDVKLEEVPLGDLTYEWLTPKRIKSPRILFHIHGGGFVLPLYNPERFTTAYLARLMGIRALLVDYRLAPEHPFPAALEDCLQAYRWLINDAGVAPQQVVFCGESAGGNLVVTTLLAIHASGLPMPCGAVSICPAFDFEFGGTFSKQNDPMSEPGFIIRQLNAYRGNADPQNPLLSPLYADLQGLPPILVQVGGSELFLSAAEAFSEKAKKAGVQVKLSIWPEMGHFWHLFVPWLPEARQAMLEIKDFVQNIPAEKI